MSDHEMTGRCLCGAIRFRATGVETGYHACHCDMCRRWSGGPLMATTVREITFEGSDKLRLHDSSDWAARGFCSDCGSNLCFYYKPGDRYVIPVGAFDDAQAFRLVGEIFVDHQPAGYAFAGDLSRATEEEFLAAMRA